jgi:type III secretion protein F
MTDTGTLLGPLAGASTPFPGESTGPYKNVDGFDQILLQASLQTQMTTIQTDIQNIENNANLSDTEKMFSMQMAMNTWVAVSTLRTNMLKAQGDCLKGIAQSIGA